MTLEFSKAGTDIKVLTQILAAYNTSLASEWEHQLTSQPLRGIIIAAGSKETMVNAFVTLWAVRQFLKCTLPVTIMHLGVEWDYINEQTKLMFTKELGEPNV